MAAVPAVDTHRAFHNVQAIADHENPGNYGDVKTSEYDQCTNQEIALPLLAFEWEFKKGDRDGFVNVFSIGIPPG